MIAVQSVAERNGNSVTSTGMPHFNEYLNYEFSLQWSMLICTYFSLNKLHFCYSKQLPFASLAAFTCKVLIHRKLISNSEIFTLWTVFMEQVTFTNQGPPVNNYRLLLLHTNIYWFMYKVMWVLAILFLVPVRLRWYPVLLYAHLLHDIHFEGL
jgi:hypothetical protein